jgi:hypothetical protein
MTSKPTNKFSPRGPRPSGADGARTWQGVSVALGGRSFGFPEIGCSAHTLNEWVKKAEFDGVPSEVTEKLTFRPRRIPSATLSQWPATPVDLQDMVATRRDRAACRPR